MRPSPRRSARGRSDRAVGVLWIDGHRLPWLELREATGVPVLVDGAQVGRCDPVDARTRTSTPSRRECSAVRRRARSRCVTRCVAPDAAELSLGAVRPRSGDVRGAGGRQPLRHALHAARGDCRTVCRVRDTSRWRTSAPPKRPRAAASRSPSARGRDRAQPANLVSFRNADPEATVARLAENGAIVATKAGPGLAPSCGWWTATRTRPLGRGAIGEPDGDRAAAARPPLGDLPRRESARRTRLRSKPERANRSTT